MKIQNCFPVAIITTRDRFRNLKFSRCYFALEFIKKLVIAWDPNYTKVTPAERAELERAQKEIENGETISHDAINWD